MRAAAMLPPAVAPALMASAMAAPVPIAMVTSAARIRSRRSPESGAPSSLPRSWPRAGASDRAPRERAAAGSAARGRAPTPPTDPAGAGGPLGGLLGVGLRGARDCARQPVPPEERPVARRRHFGEIEDPGPLAHAGVGVDECRLDLAGRTLTEEGQARPELRKAPHDPVAERAGEAARRDPVKGLLTINLDGGEGQGAHGGGIRREVRDHVVVDIERGAVRARDRMLVRLA